MPTKGREVFLSYAREDEPLQKELAKHIAPLEEQGYITSWHSGEIDPGSPIINEIDSHLNSASIILYSSALTISTTERWSEP